VELADNGHVSGLKLKSNGLIETLPGRMIRGLVGLQVLDLSDNDLRGGVPDDRTFEMWPDLTHMILSDNPHLGGGLHPSLPNACKRLQVLQLFNANLTGPHAAAAARRLPARAAADAPPQGGVPAAEPAHGAAHGGAGGAPREGPAAHQHFRRLEELHLRRASRCHRR